MAKNKKDKQIPKVPTVNLMFLDGPGIKVGSKEFQDMVLNVMINKHNNPDEDFNLTK